MIETSKARFKSRERDGGARGKRTRICNIWGSKQFRKNFKNIPNNILTILPNVNLGRIIQISGESFKSRENHSNLGRLGSNLGRIKNIQNRFELLCLVLKLFEIHSIAANLGRLNQIEDEYILIPGESFKSLEIGLKSRENQKIWYWQKLVAFYCFSPPLPARPLVLRWSSMPSVRGIDAPNTADRRLEQLWEKKYKFLKGFTPPRLHNFLDMEFDRAGFEGS